MFTQINNTLLVNEVMMPLDKIPVVAETVILKEALEEMGRTRLGIACVVNAENKLLGILTDGDFRRKLLKVQKPFSAFLVDDALAHAIRAPITARPNDTLVRAVDVMGQKQIWDLPVVDEYGLLVGLLHLHPAVQALLGIQSN